MVCPLEFFKPVISARLSLIPLRCAAVGGQAVRPVYNRGTNVFLGAISSARRFCGYVTNFILGALSSLTSIVAQSDHELL